jgi:hypothetical protein
LKDSRELRDRSPTGTRIFFRELLQDKFISWVQDIGWRKRGLLLERGDKRFSDGGLKIKTVSQYRKEAVLRDDEQVYQAVYEVEHHRFGEDPLWRHDAEASYMRDAGLAYIKQEEGFKGMRGCFEMMASHDLN